MQHDLSGYPEPIRAVLAAQFRLSRCVVSTQMQEWAQLELTIGQLKVMMILAGHPGMTISQIAESLSISKPSTSILVDGLVQQGLAHRAEDESDRRRTLVTLTTAGNDLTTRLHQGSIERLVQWYSALAPDDLAALRHGLEALAEVAAPADASIDPFKSTTTR
ncbi:MAG: MarR family winged helix-turn-helix transcriptional regulator [Ktedonobacterales bacterium]